jgi:hypothetical protein
VVVKVRRVGGGFGGKISRNVQASTASAIVASKLNVPCRFILPLQTNLTIAGRRLPSQCEYEVSSMIFKNKSCSMKTLDYFFYKKDILYFFIIIIIISLLMSPCWGTGLPYGLPTRRTGHNPPRGPSADWRFCISCFKP